MSERSMSATTDASVATEAIPMTPEGRERLQAELAQLTNDRRPELVKQVQRSRLFLSPDASKGATSVAEYDLGILDDQIKQLADLIKRIQVIPEPPDDKTVQIGSRVEVRYDDEAKDSDTLTIVGPFEGDPSRGFVSSESALGKAMLGKADGAKVTVGEGDAALTLTVVSIGKETESAPTDASAGDA